MNVSQGKSYVSILPTLAPPVLAWLRCGPARGVLAFFPPRRRTAPRADRRRANPQRGVLALHGNGNFGHDPVAGRDDRPGVTEAIKACNYDYGRQLVRRGYVVAVPCLTPFGRRLGDREAYGKQDACAITFLRL